MRKDKQKDRKLRVEELEKRTAPLALNPADAAGDGGGGMGTTKARRFDHGSTGGGVGRTKFLKTL